MDSLRIGICDDEAEDLSQVMEMVSRYDESKQLHIASFLHASDLLLAFKQSPFDIVILDIEMEPPTGLCHLKRHLRLEGQFQSSRSALAILRSVCCCEESIDDITQCSSINSSFGIGELPNKTLGSISNSFISTSSVSTLGIDSPRSIWPIMPVERPALSASFSCVICC